MSEQEQEPRKLRWLVFTFLAGVVLPSISILVETTTHICADTFFDPIPTTWHVVMVIFVPLAHLQVWLAIRRGSTERGMLLGLANAAAIGISIFYTIIYLPLLPLAVAALLFFGLGVLPMAPLFSLIAGIMMRRQLRRAAPASFAFKTTGLAAGITLAFAAILLMELPATLTRVGLQMAASESPERSAQGLRWLRAVGDRDYMLRASYGRTGRATDFIGYLFSVRDPVTPEQGRQIYYRVTGETFNTAVPPRRIGSRWEPQENFDFDPDQGGTVIAGRVRNLSLAGSRLDGTIDADAGLAYVEWTLLFRNNSAQQQEARAQVQLPPGGVVSRLTLWVDGEEREAAFAGRSQAREAYQQVAIRQRRDPVLVTTSGRDRILVQCFPVPPNGGEMRIRFGITVPLMLESREQAILRPPYFLERNFGIPDEVAHTVWIESKNPLRASSGSLRYEQPAAALHAVRGSLREVEMAGPEALVRASRAAEITESWTLDRVRNNGEVIRQSIREGAGSTVSRIVLVVDTSGRMRAWVPEIIAALRTLPPDTELQLLFAGGNGTYAEGASQNTVSETPAEIIRQLEGAVFAGGANNIPALARGWDTASGNPQSAVVWIHGPQPILLTPVEELRQRLERRPGGASLYLVQAENGPNRVAEQLDGMRAVETVPRMGRLQADLATLFARLTGQSRPLELARTSERQGQAVNPGDAKETSAHLARLWANDEVERIMAERGEAGREEAVQLATRYQLVTPVSGAVVLETQEQYQRAGLQPVAAGTVPTIPEPEMVLLMAVVAAILMLLLYRQVLLRRRTA